MLRSALHIVDALLDCARLACAPQLSRSQPRRVRSAAPGASRTLSTKIDFYRSNPELCMVRARRGPGAQGQRVRVEGLGKTRHWRVEAGGRAGVADVYGGEHA